MKAVVLSGGEGSRLRPITHTNAKQLIPIANKPILFHALEAISDAGIHEVAIVVGHTEAEIRSAVGDGSAWGLQVEFLPQAAPLGIADAVRLAREFVADQPFVVYLGDNVLLEGVGRFVREFESHRPNAQIFLAKVREPEHFGVATLEGDRVTQLVEKPREFVSDLALVGVYLFDSTVFDAIEKLEPSWRDEYEITEAIQLLIDAGLNVRAEMVTGWWKDTGRPEDLLEANRIMLTQLTPSISGEVDDQSQLEGTVVIEAGSKVIRSRIRGPAIVGEGTVVENSQIGPHTSIYYGCTVTEAEIEDSIVMEQCRIDGVRGLTGSILGRDVEVRGSGVGAGALSLTVGDQSQIHLS